MASFTYPVVVRPDDNDTFWVSFPDFPEAHTFGATKEEALGHALDALASAIAVYMSDRREIPEPSAVRQLSIALPLIMATKVELYRAMREQGIGKAALSRRLDVHMPQIDRLLDLRHSSQLSQLEKAFHAIDRELEIEVQVVRKPLKARLKASRSKQKSGAM